MNMAISICVTIMGYLQWGLEEEVVGIPAGHLGGWGFDLMSLWGSFEAQDGENDLRRYMRNKLASRDERSPFGYADFLADADAYLVAQKFKSKRFNSLSEVLRWVFNFAPKKMIRLFAEECFYNDQDEVIEAFCKISQAFKGVARKPEIIDNDGVVLVKAVESFVEQNYKKAGGFVAYPSIDESKIMTEEYFNALERF